jgi:GNAT superfamily N-acetyltransferase
VTIDRPTTDRPTGPGALVGPAAANLAAWHDSSVAALGWPSRAGGGWWTCPLPGPTIYHAAITLRPRARRRRLRTLLADDATHYVSVCDSFADLDLAPLGLRAHTEGSWYVRPAEPLAPGADRSPDDLTIAPVTDPTRLARFESTMVRAFEVPIFVGKFDVHAPGILEDRAMTVLLGSVGDEPTCVAMAYETDDLVGVYGVGTVPAWRARGHATALMRRVLTLRPAKPTSLQPTEAAKSLYRRLGFVDVGSFVHWL